MRAGGSGAPAGTAPDEDEDVTFTEDDLGLGAAPPPAQPMGGAAPPLVLPSGGPPLLGMHPPLPQQALPPLFPPGMHPAPRSAPPLQQQPPGMPRPLGMPPLAVPPSALAVGQPPAWPSQQQQQPAQQQQQPAQQQQQPAQQQQQPAQQQQQPAQQQQQQQQELPQQEPAQVRTGYGPDGLTPQRDAVAAFKSLLCDKGVHAFSRYERELPKLQPDKRFKVGGSDGMQGQGLAAASACGLPAPAQSPPLTRPPPLLHHPLQYLPTTVERKAAFEEYCKETAAGRRSGAGASAGGPGSKAAGKGTARQAAGEATAAAGPPPPAVPSPVADFERLLSEAEAACVAGSGAPTPGASEEEGQLLPAWGAGLQLADLETRWGGDPRWSACPRDQRAAALERRLGPTRAAARRQHEADFRALLRVAGVTAASRWSHVRDDLSADPRYLALPRDDRWARGAGRGR